MPFRVRGTLFMQEGLGCRAKFRVLKAPLHRHPKISVVYASAACLRKLPDCQISTVGRNGKKYTEYSRAVQILHTHSAVQTQSPNCATGT